MVWSVLTVAGGISDWSLEECLTVWRVVWMLEDDLTESQFGGWFGCWRSLRGWFLDAELAA